LRGNFGVAEADHDRNQTKTTAQQISGAEFVLLVVIIIYLNRRKTGRRY
jgi:hypothetical protein